MKNLSSYCGLVDARKIRASDKDLPVKARSKMTNCHWRNNNRKKQKENKIVKQKQESKMTSDAVSESQSPMDFSSEELAVQLTLIDLEIFKKLHPGQKLVFFSPDSNFSR